MRRDFTGLKQGWERAFTLPLATLPIGLFVAWRVIVEPPSRGHNRLLAMSGAQLLAFAALMCWGIVKAKDVMPGSTISRRGDAAESRTSRRTRTRRKVAR
jgi:hypothetical protein